MATENTRIPWRPIPNPRKPLDPLPPNLFTPLLPRPLACIPAKCGDRICRIFGFIEDQRSRRGYRIGSGIRSASATQAGHRPLKAMRSDQGQLAIVRPELRGMPLLPCFNPGTRYRERSIKTLLQQPYRHREAWGCPSRHPWTNPVVATTFSFPKERFRSLSWRLR